MSHGPWNRAWLLAILVFACAPVDRGPKWKSAGAPTPRDGGTLRAGTELQLRTLDPTIGYDEATATILHPLFDTLVDFSPSGTELVPRLAERWTISPDGRVYTFELRPGIAYVDGAPITAAHVKYSLERALATSDSMGASYLGDIEGATDVLSGKAQTCAGITIEGDRRLVIRLLQPFSAFLDVLAMTFAAPQRPEHVAAAGDQLRRRPDATGPYQLISWDEGNRIVLGRNPHYYDPGRSHLDTIELYENVPRDTQFQMFERGELDVVDRLAAPDYLFVMAEPAWQPYAHRTVGMNAFGSRMNVRVKPFDDRRVRQAFNYALDKSHTARLLNATTVPAHGILPPGMFGRDDLLAPYPHDVARARALLAEAGYPDGLDVEYATSNDEETEKVAASLQSDLAEAGIRVRLTIMSWATFITAIGTRDGPPFSFISWIADYPDPTNFLDPKFRTPRTQSGATNDSFYTNPALDAVLDAARREPDRRRREAMYHQAERILHDDAPWIWDYHRATINVVQPYVQSYQAHPIWLRDFTSAWLDLGPDGARVKR